MRLDRDVARAASARHCVSRVVLWLLAEVRIQFSSTPKVLEGHYISLFRGTINWSSTQVTLNFTGAPRGSSATHVIFARLFLSVSYVSQDNSGHRGCSYRAVQGTPSYSFLSRAKTRMMLRSLALWTKAPPLEVYCLPTMTPLVGRGSMLRAVAKVAAGAGLPRQLSPFLKHGILSLSTGVTCPAIAILGRALPSCDP